MPRFLLLRERPSSGVCKTEENGARKGTRWTIAKALPVGVDDMSWCSFSINFCDLYYYCCFIILAKSLSLIIICSFFSRFCTLSSSSCCSAKVIWVSLEISVLSSGRLETVIADYHSWRELIYHLFGTDLLRFTFDLFLYASFKKFVLLVLQQCDNYSVVVSGRWTRIKILGWTIDPVDGAQCKCKRKKLFVLDTLLWNCRVTDYCQISSIGNCLPRLFRVRRRGGRLRETC